MSDSALVLNVLLRQHRYGVLKCQFKLTDCAYDGCRLLATWHFGAGRYFVFHFWRTTFKQCVCVCVYEQT